MSSIKSDAEADPSSRDGVDPQLPVSQSKVRSAFFGSSIHLYIDERQHQTKHLAPRRIVLA